MSKKSLTISIIIIAIIIVGGLTYWSSFPAKIKPSALKDSQSVCQYIQQDNKQRFVEGTQTPFTKCDDYVCEARDGGQSWNVSYRCPGPSNFPMGEEYLMNIDKTTGSIKVNAVSN